VERILKERAKNCFLISANAHAPFLHLTGEVCSVALGSSSDGQLLSGEAPLLQRRASVQTGIYTTKINFVQFLAIFKLLH